MKITYQAPTKKVSEYVQSILVIENYRVTNNFVLPFFANGTPTILFQTSKGRIKNNNNYLTLFGQTVCPDEMLLTNNFTLIAYFLKPYCLNSLFGINANDLTDNPVDLNLFFKKIALQERLLHAATTSEMISLLDNYIFDLTMKIETEATFIKYATEKIINSHHKNILSQVQKELHLTERTFQRMFEKYVGTSPNQFRRICQFQKTFQQLNQGKFHSLSDLAFNNGYADQSHFNRTFKEFTNLTTREYLNKCKLA